MSFQRGEDVLLKFGEGKSKSYTVVVFLQTVKNGLQTVSGNEDTCLVRMNNTEIIVLKSSVRRLLH